VLFLTGKGRCTPLPPFWPISIDPILAFVNRLLHLSLETLTHMESSRFFSNWQNKRKHLIQTIDEARNSILSSA
jgi:hypothetical protein